jgi:hypothetical protein
MPGIFKRLQGQHGRVDIPDLGAHIGGITSWTLTRRGDGTNPKDPEAEFYDLNAVLAFITESLFLDPDYTKRVTIQHGKGQAYRLEPELGPGQRTALVGRNLIMERVRIKKVNGNDDG